MVPLARALRDHDYEVAFATGQSFGSTAPALRKAVVEQPVYRARAQKLQQELMGLPDLGTAVRRRAREAQPS